MTLSTTRARVRLLKLLTLIRIAELAVLGLLCWGSVLMMDRRLEAALCADVAGLVLHAVLVWVERRLERALAAPAGHPHVGNKNASSNRNTVNNNVVNLASSRGNLARNNSRRHP